MHISRCPDVRPARWVLGAAALVLLVPALATPAAAADTVDVDGVGYELRSPASPSLGAAATSYDPVGNDEHPAVTLPPSVTIDGRSVPVRAVGAGAFQDEGLEAVALPDGLTTIGNRAFEGNRLTELVLPPSVTGINGVRAFGGNALASIDLPGSMTHLGNSVFSENELTSIDLPAGLEYLGHGVFSDNTLAQVDLPPALATMGQDVFQDNPTLGTIRFLGPAPEIIGGPENSPVARDVATTPRVEHLWRHGETSGLPQAFTWPTWYGLATEPLIEVDFVAGAATGAHLPESRLVPLYLGTPQDDAPWGTIAPDDAPPTPTAPGLLFAGWTTVGDDPSPWTYGQPLRADTTLSALWRDDSPRVAAIEVTASAARVDVGGTVTLAAEGFDAAGTSLGDVTDDTLFASDVATDVVAGDQITFPTASSHTITGTHEASEARGSVVVEVDEVVEVVEVDGTDTADAPAGFVDDGGVSRVGTEGGDDDGARPATTPVPTDTVAASSALPATGASPAVAVVVAVGTMLLGMALVLTARRAAAGRKA